MSFSRTRSVAAKQHRNAGGGDNFYNCRSVSFPGWINGHSNNSSIINNMNIVNGSNLPAPGGYGRERSSLKQLQRRHPASDDVVAALPVKRRRSMLENPEGRSEYWRSTIAVGHCGNGPSTSDSSFLHPIGAVVRHDPGYRYLPSDTDVPSTRAQAIPEEHDMVLMSRDEIERCSPSRKDGIDLVRETHLRYSYCAFLQNLGMRLDLPQTTIGTAMVLCHRFFVHRSHACHDRFLIATAALFLAAKSEETPCPLNTVLRASCEICHKQDPAFFSYLLPVDWFEQHRERIIEAEQMILTTLNFELNVQHPYTPLTSILDKLGLSQTVLVNLAWNLVNEGVLTRILCSPMWCS